MKKLVRLVIVCFVLMTVFVGTTPIIAEAAQKATVVTNQKQLDQAVKAGKKNIQIKTTKGIKLTIPVNKKISGTTITINAKNATIINRASVKSITIKDAKCYTENGKNNTVSVADKKLSFIVAKTSQGTTIKVTAKSDLTLSGSAKSPVKITVSAKNTTVKSSVAIDATLKADASIKLAKGAENSKLTTAKGIKADVVNNTKSSITLKDSSGIATNIPTGKTGSFTDQFPKVDFSKSDDVITGKVSFERNELLLTVAFMSNETVFDKNGNKLENWTVEIGLHQPASDQFCVEDGPNFSGDNEENVTAVFEIFEGTAGVHSFQFDYEVYADDAKTQFIGKKTVTVNYELTQDDVNKLTASYAGTVRASGKDSIRADFSAVNGSETGDFWIKKQGEDNVTWIDMKNIWDAEESKPYQYDIELEKELENGTYIVLVSYPGSDNAQYLGKFTYDVSGWTTLDAARECVKAQMDNIDLWDTSITAESLKQQLQNAVQSATGDNQIQIDVDRFEDEEGESVSVNVSIIKGDLMYIENFFDAV